MTGLPLDAADPTGQGGNSNKGDLCRRLLVDHRELMVSFAPPRFQKDYRLLLERVWNIIQVYNSKRRVDTTLFKQYCLETYHHILTSFNNETRWINISPTLHSLLGHSWELIEKNDGKGLGEYTESGLEHCNKFLRFYRRNLARKISQVTNLEDCLTRLWLRSEPQTREAGPGQPACTRCDSSGHFTVSCPEKKTLTAMSHAEFRLEQLFLD